MAKSLLDIVRNAESASRDPRNGYEAVLELHPPLSAVEMKTFSELLPCPIPEDVRQLLEYTRGFETRSFKFLQSVERVEFSGQMGLFGLEEVFPNGVQIASDGCGNFWVIDLTETSTKFGPVYFACHDAPVILYQCDSPTEFLTELFAGSTSNSSLITAVEEDRLFNVWWTNPGVLSYADCFKSTDPTISEFVKELDHSWSVVDLRDASIGMGFSWGRFGSKTELKRYGSLPIFAYRRPKGLFRWLFG